MNKVLKMIKTAWFWSGLILIIASISLLITFFGGKIFTNNTYDLGNTTNPTSIMNVELHKDNTALVKKSGGVITCYYSIQGDKITINSTPDYDRAYGSFEMTFKIKNRFTIVSEENNPYKADNLILIYIYQAMGISGLIFIASGIDAIKKHIKNKKQIKASE